MSDEETFAALVLYGLVAHHRTLGQHYMPWAIPPPPPPPPSPASPIWAKVECATEVTPSTSSPSSSTRRARDLPNSRHPGLQSSGSPSSRYTEVDLFEEDKSPRFQTPDSRQIYFTNDGPSYKTHVYGAPDPTIFKDDSSAEEDNFGATESPEPAVEGARRALSTLFLASDAPFPTNGNTEDNDDDTSSARNYDDDESEYYAGSEDEGSVTSIDLDDFDVDDDELVSIFRASLLQQMEREAQAEKRDGDDEPAVYQDRDQPDWTSQQLSRRLSQASPRSDYYDSDQENVDPGALHYDSDRSNKENHAPYLESDPEDQEDEEFSFHSDSDKENYDFYADSDKENEEVSATSYEVPQTGEEDFDESKVLLHVFEGGFAEEKYDSEDSWQ